MFARRNDRGEIIAVSRDATAEIAEPLEPGDPELSRFLSGAAGRDAIGALQASDLEVVRVLEDLIDVLIGRGVIQFTDLPEAAQKKLLGRKRLRQAGDFTLFDDDEGIL